MSKEGKKTFSPCANKSTSGVAVIFQNGCLGNGYCKVLIIWRKSGLMSMMEEQPNEYSLSFELDDTDESLQLSSEDMSQCSSGSKKIIREDRSAVHNSKKPPRPPSSEASVNFNRTIRSPLAMSHLLNQDGVSRGDDPQSPPPPPHSPPLARFKQVAGSVQKMQSTAKKFKNSSEIREVAFKEWLAKKEVKDISEKIKKTASMETENEKAKEQERQVVKLTSLTDSY